MPTYANTSRYDGYQNSEDLASEPTRSDKLAVREIFRELNCCARKNKALYGAVAEELKRWSPLLAVAAFITILKGCAA